MKGVACHEVRCVPISDIARPYARCEIEIAHNEESAAIADRGGGHMLARRRRFLHLAAGAAALSGSRISRLGSQISLTGCHVDRNRHMLVHD
jgi:hypothetical protein